jgi:GT2 family glycosyltransferase
MTVSVDPARTGIFISTFNRARYTRRSLASLAAHPPDPRTRIVIVDDASTDFGAGALTALEALRAAHPRTRVLKNAVNQGIAGVVHQFVELAGIFRMTHLYVTDNDMVYGGGWFDELLACYEYLAARHRRAIATCLNAPKHGVLGGPASNARFVERPSVGGASWFASLETVRELLTPDIISDWDVRCVARLQALGGIIGTTRRSYVQHIGAFGLHSRGVHDRGIAFVDDPPRGRRE